MTYPATFKRPVLTAALTLALLAAAATAPAATPRIAVGDGFVLVLRTDGSVWAWGRGTDGQLGNGTRSTTSRPVRVSGLAGVVDVAAADGVAAALKADGTVWVWGSGANGIFGSTQADNTIRALTPTLIPELSGIATLALGRNGASAWAADQGGRVFQWGNNFSGQAGDGTSSSNGAVRKQPRQVPGLANIAALAAADDSFVAAGRDAQLSGWGYNESGALGVTARTTRGGPPLAVQPVPTGLGEMVALASLDINDNVQFGVLRSGGVAGWGSNRGSHAGCGQVSVSTPVITAPRLVTGVGPIVAAAGGTAHALFVGADGAVLGCGANANGQLGDNSTADTTTAKPGPLRTSLTVPAAAVGAGRNTSAAVGTDGSVWVWGQAGNGLAGDDGAVAGNSGLQFLTPRAVVAESGTGVFDAGRASAAPALFTGTQTGPLDRVTLDVGFSPLPADVGTEAHIYLAAVLPDGTLYVYSDATGWQPYAGGRVMSYRRVVLSRHVPLPLYRDANLSGTAGVQLLVGYGRGSNEAVAEADLLSRGTYGAALTLR